MKVEPILAGLFTRTNAMQFQMVLTWIPSPVRLL